MYNNAIALMDVANQSDIVAPLVIQSVRPNSPNTYFDVDNNIYYAPDNVLVRFIEQSPRHPSQIYRRGTRGQFRGLEQWKFITQMDQMTAINNFYPDLHISGHPQSLRVLSPAPMGSYLSYKGKRFDFVQFDILKKLRGAADKGYSIGA
jgi:hypothetical protein